MPRTIFLVSQVPLGRPMTLAVPHARPKTRYLGDVASDYVYQGARVQWVADVAVRNTSVGSIYAQGIENVFGLTDWASYFNVLKAGIESHGFSNVQGELGGMFNPQVNLVATTPVDFGHLPDIQGIFTHEAYTAGLDATVGANNIYLLTQGPGHTGQGNPTQNTPGLPQGAGDTPPGSNTPSLAAVGLEAFFKSLGISLPVAAIGGGLLLLLILRK